MPGSFSLNAPCYLPALVGAPSQGNSLLASLAGKTGRAPGNSGAAPDLTHTNAARPLAPAAVEPAGDRDIAQFKQALAVANTPAQLLANPVALRVLLTSHGLADQAGNSALATRVLLSNSARANSLLNQLKDPRWLAVNNLYSFATQGLETLRNPESVAAVARGYADALQAASLAHIPPDPPGEREFPDCPPRSGTS